MNKHMVTILAGAAALGFVPSTEAQTIGGYSFLAGLVDVTDASTVTGSKALTYATDNSIYTVCANLGAFGGTGFGGTFGGGSYSHGSGPDIILTTLGDTGGAGTLSGTFDVSLILDDGSQTPKINYGNDDFIFVNNGEITYEQANDSQGYKTLFGSYYLPLDIANFDTGGQGVIGIEFTAFTSPMLDLGYVGVTTLANVNPVPEPTTMVLVALGSLVLVARRRRQF